MQPSRQLDSALNPQSSLQGELAHAPAAASRPRRKRKRRTVVGFGPRIAFAGVMAALGVVCLCAVVSKLLQPYQMQHQQSGHIRQLKMQLAEIDADNSELQTKIMALKRPDGVETAARAQGYLKPGEVSLDITAQQPAPQPKQSDTGFAEILSREFHSLTGR